jgi:hypothetical protein
MSTTDTTTPGEAAQRTLDALIEPLRLQVAEFDRLVVAQTAELQKTRATRTQLRRALEMLDPSYVKPKKTKSAVKMNGNLQGSGFSAQSLNEVYEYLKEREDELNVGKGFTGSELGRRPDAPTSQSRLNKALTLLHEQGLIRLDSTVGIAKNYKVI